MTNSTHPNLVKEKLLLIAGSTNIPIEFVESAKKAGQELVVFSLEPSNSSKIKSLGVPCYDFSVFQIHEMKDMGIALGIKYLSFIGKVPKSSFFKNLHKIDKELLEEIWALKDLNDDSLHNKIVDFVQSMNNAQIIDQSTYLKHLFPEVQTFTKRQADEKELEEIEYGLKMARANASLDIGQTVITKNKSVIAVEAIEGTNNCIERAKKLIGFFDKNKVIYVSKVSKPEQDQRFDIPTVGLETIKAMPKNSFLSFEANETFFIDQEKAIDLANKKNICINSCKLSV